MELVRGGRVSSRQGRHWLGMVGVSLSRVGTGQGWASLVRVGSKLDIVGLVWCRNCENW